MRPLVALCLLLFCPPFSFGAETAQEHDLQAAFIFNFIKFVEWPESPRNDGDKIKLCVTPNTPIHQALKALDGRSLLGGKRIVLLHWTNEQTQSCSVLVLENGDQARLSMSRKQLISGKVLTIGTSPEVNHEVVISMDRAGGRIVFDIDNNLARQSGLIISSRLLRLARSVQ